MTALADARSPEVAGDRLLVVPLGAPEQHGPHLPLGTDTVIAGALAAGLSGRLGDRVSVAPALPYGSSGEHQTFPGTVSIGAAATETVLVELVRSANSSFPRVLLLCAHGGNAEPLARALARLRAEGRDVRAFSPAQAWSGDAHAGEVETSVMLALDPGAVAMERAAAGARAPLTELMPALRAGGVGAVSENGVLGDPTPASAAAGRARLAAALDALVTFVEQWA